MQWLSKRTIARIYLVALLIVGIIVSPLPQYLLALALLILQLYIIYRPPIPKINVALLLGTLFLTPLTLIPLAESFLSSLLILPVIYLLDSSLKDNARTLLPQPQKRPRQATSLLKSITIALITILVFSLVVINLVIASVAAILMLYLAGLASLVLHRIPKKPILYTQTLSRILAGESEIKKITFSAKTNLPIYTGIWPLDLWVKVMPTKIQLTPKKQTEIDVIYTPPLAGPTRVQLQTATVDPWGLIQINQTLAPIELHVIPRAKYAQWLAMKFIEQSGSSGISVAPTITIRALGTMKTGVEYYGSRSYQPGDSLKEVDWKQTVIHNELIVKEFSVAQGQPVIISVELTAENLETADKLASKIVMIALTAASESLPLGLVAFKEKEVIISIAPTDSREALKKTINLIAKISTKQQPLRFNTEPANHKLKESNQKNSTTQAIAKLLEVEYEINRIAAKNHPATVALKKILQKTLPSAIIIYISNTNSSSEALLFTLRKLNSRGYKIFNVKVQ
jgi:uncharacterized protein (DUF58 family)